MASDVAIWHYPDAVTGHSLAQKALSSLGNISDRDYPSAHYFSCDIPALDMDRYEASLHGDNKKTADAVVGICNERQGKAVDGRLLLVELRMDYRTVSNLSVSSLAEKETHTRQLLRSCPDDRRIDLSYCLIFDYKLEQQAYSWMSRIRRSDKVAEAWRTFTPATFCNYINIGKTMPYTPCRETVEAGERFKSAARTGTIEAFDKEWSVIEAYMLACALRNEFGECAYLSEVLTEAVALFDTAKLDDESDRAYFDIINEDIMRLAGCHQPHKSPK